MENPGSPRLSAVVTSSTAIVLGVVVLGWTGINFRVRGACAGRTSQCYGPSADVTAAALAATAASPTIRVPFISFSGGMPNPTADPSTIVTVKWQVTAPLGSTDAGGCAADFTVKNVAFYK